MIYAVAIFLLWTVSFFFAGIEAGLLSVDPVRLRHQVKQGRRSALRLDRLTKRPERLLITVLLVTNLANILSLLLFTRSFVLRFEIAFPAFPFSRPGSSGRRSGMVLRSPLACPRDRRAGPQSSPAPPG
jgi:CBS domain containing-hemolysin-like protein